MPVVTNTILDPGGSPVANARVQIDLIGTDGAGYVGASSLTVFDVFETRTQGDGTWTATLVANTLITNPTGTVYRITEARREDAGDHQYHISVPAGAGPYWVGDILTVAPSSVSLLANPMTFTEISDPAAPGANQGLLYVRDNGSGKSQIVARFPSGSVQVIATEP